MKRILSGLVAITLSAVLWTAPANADPIFSIDPNPVPVSAGDSFVVEIVASNLDDIISAFDILVDYDETLLEANSISFCVGPLDPFFSFCDASFGTGVNEVSQLSLLSDAQLADLQSGLESFTLATMGFTAIADGIAEFAFIWDEFHDVKCSDNRVCSPTSVPEPGTLALLGLGLLGMGAARRRNRAS